MTQEELVKYVKYDESTGVFEWISGHMIGKITGARPNSGGYGEIRINGTLYLAHRLAWLYTHGYMPFQIDHINHDRIDNRICNLQETKQLENTKNCGIGKNNKSGVIGVSWSKERNKWHATIGVKGKTISLGRFEKKQDAIKARKDAEIFYCFHTNHGNGIAFKEVT